MTTSDLIAQLQKLPYDSHVRVLCSCHTDDIIEHEVDAIEAYISLKANKSVVQLHQGEIIQ